MSLDCFHQMLWIASGIPLHLPRAEARMRARSKAANLDEVEGQPSVSNQVVFPRPSLRADCLRELSSRLKKLMSSSVLET